MMDDGRAGGCMVTMRKERKERKERMCVILVKKLFF
jgi:hypothetical protein